MLRELEQLELVATVVAKGELVVIDGAYLSNQDSRTACSACLITT
jgi:hypothetical protein